MSSTDAKIDNIFPLRHVQRALLMHHLSETVDQGIIQNRFRLTGPLDETAFRTSWRLIIERHAALRTSVHWEGIDKPVSVVRSVASVPLTIQDWIAKPTHEHPVSLRNYLSEELLTGLDLTIAPAWKLTLIKLSQAEHQLIWTTHHLLLDGWSAAVIMRDFFSYYAAALSGKSVQLPSIPSYKTYLNWISSKNEKASLDFWQNYLKDLSTSTYFPTATSSQSHRNCNLSKEKSSQLREFAAKRRLSLNAVFQGIYAILLSRYFNRSDVSFGTVVSGRSPELINSDLTAGLFANMIPIRITSVENESIENYLERIQQDLVKGSPHHFVELDRVLESSGWKGRLPFNTLFLFQNHRWDQLEGGDLKVTEFEGDLTVNFPLNCVIIPGPTITIQWVYQNAALTAEVVDWLSTSFIRIIESWLNGERVNLKTAPILKVSETTKTFTAPSNPTELDLVSIWENLLATTPIGIDDDFFAIGGTSLQALRLFAQIESKWNVRHSPTSLLKHRTIRSLALLIDGKRQPEAWSNIVPLKAAGSKPPLFCFHGGAGHIFFYHPLTRYIDGDRPLYAVQPEGLDRASILDRTIEEMADRYLTEIEQVNPGSKLILLAYCFSTAVCLEVGNRILKAGGEPPIIIIVDSSPRPEDLYTKRTYIEDYKTFSWHRKKLLAGQWRRILYIYILRWAPEFLLKGRRLVEARALRVRSKMSPAIRRYIWSTYDGPVLLIRSSDFAEKRNKDFHLETWRRLVPKNLTIVTLDGLHAGLFEQPTVSKLGQVIEEYLKVKVL